MKNSLHFEQTIKAPVQKVWETMLGLETYKLWTQAFDPTSYFEGSWEKGSKIKFLGSTGEGMVAEIAENDHYKFVSIKTLGFLKGGVEDTTSEEAKKWAEGFENYTFVENGEETLLKVDLEMVNSPEFQEMREMFAGMWPKALLKLKELCEK